MALSLLFQKNTKSVGCQRPLVLSRSTKRSRELGPAAGRGSVELPVPGGAPGLGPYQSLSKATCAGVGLPPLMGLSSSSARAWHACPSSPPQPDTRRFPSSASTSSKETAVQNCQPEVGTGFGFRV